MEKGKFLDEEEAARLVAENEIKEAIKEETKQKIRREKSLKGITEEDLIVEIEEDSEYIFVKIACSSDNMISDSSTVEDIIKRVLNRKVDLVKASAVYDDRAGHGSKIWVSYLFKKEMGRAEKMSEEIKKEVEKEYKHLNPAVRANMSGDFINVKITLPESIDKASISAVAISDIIKRIIGRNVKVASCSMIIERKDVTFYILYKVEK